MNLPRTLQLLLPTDKRNPSFTLYENEATSQIHVYYGLELLQVVPSDRQHVQYKLLVANLYNAGLKVGVLEQVFGADRKTMRAWGQALQSGDATQLVRVLAGRQWQRKLTPEIASYVRHRFAAVYAAHRQQYSRQLRQEVKAVFDVDLSGETLRPLLQELRAAQKAAGRSSESAPAPDPAPHAVETEEIACELEPETALCGLGSSKLSPATWAPGQARWCDHLGVLLFWNSLSQLAAVLTPPAPVLKQWLASVLLGAMNIEQTKYLNWRELDLLLGPVVWGPTPQRHALTELARPATVQAVWRWNARQVGALPESDFYLDPHTKHYTGEQPILKGWCAAIRWADKALHSDFVHTVRGEAIYCECTDNFADLRERLWGVLSRLRQTLEWPAEKVLTVVVDRGIFGQEVFTKVVADPALHLITWEKGYQPGQWQEELKAGEFLLQRVRNRAQDLRSYHFKYLDRPWAKVEGMRQLIVVATNPAGRSVEASVLTDDAQRPAPEALRLIFSRWLQENDFKYEDKHFGINQITSYRSVAYEKLRGQVQDRQVRSGEAKALTQARLDLERQQKRLLFTQEQADRRAHRRQQTITELEAKLAARAAPVEAPAEAESARAQKRLAGLRVAQQRQETIRTERRQQIQGVQEKLEANQQVWAAVQKEESRLEQVIAQGMRRLDTRNKQLMDAIKITAGNAFRQALQPFKKAYDNYRDDHDYFRRLTQAGGVLRWTGQAFEVHLLPQVNYPPALATIITAWLTELNAVQPQLPDGSQRALKFYLSDRDDFEIRLKGT